MVDLIATKSMGYATRRLKPEEPFQANSRDARLLVAIGKARYATTDGQAVEPKHQPAPAPKPAGGEDLKVLRAAYQAKTGKRAFNGWDAATLRTKIAEA